MMKSNKILFLTLMMLSTILSISAMSWLTAWVGLEINLLSIMPLMKNFKNSYSSEAAIKYFVVQAMASSIMLFTVIIYICMNNWTMDLEKFHTIMIMSILLMKMGAAPFHFWYPPVMSGLTWQMNFIMMTWQKVAPMILLSYTKMNSMVLSITIILSSIISGLQGINQTCLRKIMAYSSINHVSWMLSAMMNSMTIWLYYFITYSILNLIMINIMTKNNIYYLNQLFNSFLSDKKIKFFFMLNFLSLGGLPPFLGFFPKWMTVNHMIKNNYYILMIMLIIFTLISLYFYMRITFATFSMNSKESLIKIFNQITYFHFMINLFSMMGLIGSSIMANLF